MRTPGSGPQPPEQDPSRPGEPAGWAQQPPAGQPYPGQQPWGPPPPGTGAQVFGQPEQSQQKRPAWLPIVGGVVALLVVLGLLNTFLGGASAEVGDCVSEKTDEIGVVDCDSNDAAYKVAGVVDDVSQNDLQNDAAVCDTWPNSVAYAWEGAKPRDLDSKGTGYCLEQLGD